MSFRPTIVVLVLAAVGVVAVWVSRGDPGATGGGAATDQRALPASAALPVDQVDRITLRRGPETMVFERADTAWSQVEPFEHPLDPFSIRQFVVQASQLQVAGVIGPDELQGLSLEALSLDPPAAEVTYEWPGGVLTLELGRRGIAGRAYLRVVGEDRVYIVNQDLHQRAVEMDPKEWRDRTIFQGVGIDAERIERVDETARLLLVRERRQWKMLEPVVTRVDGVAGPEFFGVLGRARSGGFIVDQPDDLSKFGLASPAGSLTVRTSSRRRIDGKVVEVRREQRLLIGNQIRLRSNDRFGMIEGRPVVFRVTEAVWRALFRPAAELADHTASGVLAADVAAIRISGPEGEFRLQRDLDRWLAPDHGRIEVPAGRVAELLEQLTGLRAPRVDLQPYPYDLQVATVTMHGFDARPMDTVRIARDAQTGEWALENGDDVLRIFPASMRMRLTPPEFGLSAP